MAGNGNKLSEWLMMESACGDFVGFGLPLRWILHCILYTLKAHEKSSFHSLINALNISTVPSVLPVQMRCMLTLELGCSAENLRGTSAILAAVS
jgi:hypothetical protein